MKRREFITLLGGAACVAPRGAGAAAGDAGGWVSPQHVGRSPFANLVTAFRKGLNEAGYVEDQNVAVEYRWAEGLS